jgi:hypothetical protein
VDRSFAIRLVFVGALVLSACSSAEGLAGSSSTAPAAGSAGPVTTDGKPSLMTGPVSTAPPTTTTPPTTVTTVPTFDVRGTVTTSTGTPLPNAEVTRGSAVVETDDSGVFAITDAVPGLLTVTRPGWLPASVELDGSAPLITVVLEPRVVRALRVSRVAAADPEVFNRILELADLTTVNALVFDTKDESGSVLYETEVEEAHAIGAVSPRYDPIDLVSTAKYHDLYTITRIVSFEDDYRVDVRPEIKLAGDWVDPTKRQSWEYPLDLAVEACSFGFDEIQFDYVRFPTSDAASRLKPQTQGERTAAISSFLTEARRLLHPMGCAVSADIFGIVLSSPDDQGIGQRPEDLTGILDAVSPMLYPSHYSNGWLGFDDPNDHPGPVVADALDDGLPRFGEITIMRPWLQAFYYNASQVLAQIEEAEDRGLGWILWNATGKYSLDWLPQEEER